MKNLEEFARSEPEARRIYLERRENQYKVENVERARIVQMQPFYKAVTATLLALPHRAARNYKTEIKEKIDALFEETCDVRPAYAVAYLHYRLEFLWRNQKIGLGTKLYRFYIMDAVTRKVLGGRNFISLPKKDKVKFADDLVAFAASEEKMTQIVASLNQAMEEQIVALGLSDSREKLRDTIRSDTFARSIRSKELA
jgi:hypothetical protein